MKISRELLTNPKEVDTLKNVSVSMDYKFGYLEYLTGLKPVKFHPSFDSSSLLLSLSSIWDKWLLLDLQMNNLHGCIDLIGH